MAETEEKITIGEVEDIILLPWKIKMPARIDTGARMSSIDARDICIDGGMVEFSLPKEYGGTLICLPMKGKQKVKSAQGSMKRAVVEIEICVGTKRFFTTVNLVDRSKMDYPFLLGRNINCRSSHKGHYTSPRHGKPCIRDNRSILGQPASNGGKGI